jgi:cation transport ATPase
VLGEQEGVLDVAVSLPAAMAVVSFDRARGGEVEALVRSLAAKGFTAAPARTAVGALQASIERSASKEAECAAMLKAAQLILLLNLPSLAFLLAPAACEGALSAVVQLLGLHTTLSTGAAKSIVGLAQASVALCTVGRHFYRSAYASLRAGFANMDVLIALGATASFTFSSAAMALGRNSQKLATLYIYSIRSIHPDF